MALHKEECVPSDTQGAAHYWMELPPREYTEVADVSVVRIDS